MQQSAMATGQEWSATLNTITNSEELGLPAGSWWKLVVEGSMLEIVRPVLELLWVRWASGRDGNKSFLNPSISISITISTLHTHNH